MAFRFLFDGLVYEDRFHFWCVNGFLPDPETIEMIEDYKIEEDLGFSKEELQMVRLNDIVLGWNDVKRRK